MRLFRLLSVLVLAAACAEPPTETSSPDLGAMLDEDASAFRATQAAAFRAAFAADTLGALAHVTRTTEFAADGTPRGILVQTIRPGDGAPTVETDTTGTFSNHPLGRWAPDRPGYLRNTAEDILPEDAAFLSTRARDAYRFERAQDTLLLGRVTEVFEVVAVPGEGDDQAVRRARLFVDAGTGRLSALHTERETQTLLFDERGTAFLQLRMADDGTWRPHSASIDQRIKALFQPPHHVRTERSYSAD